MDFCSIKNIPISQYKDQTFRQGVVGKVVISILFLLFSLLSFWGGYSEGNFIWIKMDIGYLWYWIGFWVAIFGALALFFVRNSLRPSAWLMKVNPERVLIKYRNYLNSHFPEEDPVVLCLEISEIEWIRKGRKALDYYTVASVRDELTFVRFLDLKLGVTVAELTDIRKVLYDERWKLPPKVGKSRTRYGGAPARLLGEGILRLQWTGISPGLEKALSIIGKTIPVKAEVKNESKSWRQLEGKEFEERIIEVADMGHEMRAMEMVKTKMKDDPQRLKEWMDYLLGRKMPPNEKSF